MQWLILALELIRQFKWDHDESNIALRKFLKQVGVTSQQAIEEALRAAGDHAAGQEFVATMTLTVKGLDL